jgi:hypothetical protein
MPRRREGGSSLARGRHDARIQVATSSQHSAGAPMIAFAERPSCIALSLRRRSGRPDRAASAPQRTIVIAQTQRCGSAEPHQPRDDRIPRERSSRRAPSRRCLWRRSDHPTHRQWAIARPRLRSAWGTRQSSVPIPAESQGRTRPRRLTQSRDSPPSGRTAALRPHRRKLVAARCAIRAREIRFGASERTCAEQKRVRRRRPLSACTGRERRAGGRVLREPLQREWTTYSAGGCSRGREGSDGCISRSDATGR